jgi:hypothetical protein
LPGFDELFARWIDEQLEQWATKSKGNGENRHNPKNREKHALAKILEVIPKGHDRFIRNIEEPGFGIFSSGDLVGWTIEAHSDE